MNLVHTFPLYFVRVNSEIILPSMPWSSKWSPFKFSDQNFISTSSLPCVLYASHLIIVDLISLIMCGEGAQIIELLVIQFSLAFQRFVTICNNTTLHYMLLMCFCPTGLYIHHVIIYCRKLKSAARTWCPPVP